MLARSVLDINLRPDNLFISQADTNTCGWDRKTLLHLAAEQGDPDLLEALLSRDVRDTASFDKMRDQQGNNPLHSACQAGSLTCVDLLLDSGMDINLQGAFLQIFDFALTGIQIILSSLI